MFVSSMDLEDPELLNELFLVELRNVSAHVVRFSSIWLKFGLRKQKRQSDER